MLIFVCYYPVQYIAISQLLIENGADVDQRSHLGKTPLIYAAESARLELVQYLISCGANVNLSDHKGETPLMMAVEHGDVEFTKYLISCGADIHAIGDEKTSLICAIKATYQNSKKMLYFVLSLGIDIDLENLAGETALNIAAQEGNTSAVRYLIEKGADLEKCDSEKVDPYFWMEINHLSKHLYKHGNLHSFTSSIFCYA